MSQNIALFLLCYNCEKQIPRVLAKLDPRLYGLFSEVIIIDNNSVDKTVESAIEAINEISGLHEKIKIVKNRKNIGFGGSYKSAFQYTLNSNLDGCIVMDGDDQANLSDFSETLMSEKFKDQIYMSARFHPLSKRRGYSSLRTIAHGILNNFFSFYFNREVYDVFGGGVNYYPSHFIKKNNFADYANDLCFVYEMNLHSFDRAEKINVFPISWNVSDQSSTARWRYLSRRVFVLFINFVFRKIAFHGNHFSSVTLSWDQVYPESKQV